MRELSTMDLIHAAREVEKTTGKALVFMSNQEGAPATDYADALVCLTDVLNRMMGASQAAQDARREAFDLEALYRAYPKRNGNQAKGRGLKRLASQIRTQADFERLKRAVENYRDHCEKEDKIGTPFVLQFATFANGDWEEWADTETARTTVQAVKPEDL